MLALRCFRSRRPIITGITLAALVEMMIVTMIATRTSATRNLNILSGISSRNHANLRFYSSRISLMKKYNQIVESDVAPANQLIKPQLSRYSNVQLHPCSDILKSDGLVASVDRPPSANPPIPGWMLKYFSQFFQPENSQKSDRMLYQNATDYENFKFRNGAHGPGSARRVPELVGYLITLTVCCGLYIAYFYERISSGDFSRPFGPSSDNHQINTDSPVFPAELFDPNLAGDSAENSESRKFIHSNRGGIGSGWAKLFYLARDYFNQQKREH